MNRVQTLPNTILHDVEETDFDGEAGTGATREEGMTSPLLASRWISLDERERGSNPLEERIRPDDWCLVLAGERQ